MTKIYIGLSKPLNLKLGAEAIKLWICAPYSHVYIRFDSSNPIIGSTVYHAAHGMVHFKTYQNFLKENITVKEYILDISEENRVILLSKCMNLAGEPYSKRQIIKIVITDFLNRLGIKIDLGDSVGYICSELVAIVIGEMYNIKYKKPIYLVNPKDIDKSLEELKK